MDLCSGADPGAAAPQQSQQKRNLCYEQCWAGVRSRTIMIWIWTHERAAWKQLPSAALWLTGCRCRWFWFGFFLQTLSTGILHPRLCPRLTSFQKQFSPFPMSLWAQLACVQSVQEQEIPREGSCSQGWFASRWNTNTFLPGQKILKYLTQQDTALHSARASLKLCAAPKKTEHLTKINRRKIIKKVLSAEEGAESSDRLAGAETARWCSVTDCTRCSAVVPGLTQPWSAVNGLFLLKTPHPTPLQGQCCCPWVTYEGSDGETDLTGEKGFIFDRLSCTNDTQTQ